MYKKTLGSASVSSCHVKCAVSNFMFYILTFYHYNMRSFKVGVCTSLYLTFPEDGILVPKHVGIILCVV